MVSRNSGLAAVAVLLAFPLARVNAQSETYRFDGVADMNPQPTDTTDWFTSVNWGEGGFDPLDPLIPDLDTRVEIQTSTLGVNAPEIRTGAAQAHQVRIGRVGGAGLLTMTGGTLSLNPFSANNRFRVGSADPEVPEEVRHPGTFNMSGGTLMVPALWVGSGSHGEMNLSGGTINVSENLYMDWTFDADSVLNMTAGTINVTGVLRMFRNSTLNLDGGQLNITGTAEIGVTAETPDMQAPDVNLNITDGLLQAGSSLRVNGSVELNGGILRAGSFQEFFSTPGGLKVNEGGTLQLRTSSESVAAVMTLISNGYITTSSPQGTGAFQISVVNLSGTDFTQVTLPPGGLDGDFDLDDDVDGQDLLIWQRELGVSLDANDLADWRANFGTVNQVASVSQAPEPSAAALAMMVGVAAAAGRRGRRRVRRFRILSCS